MQDSSVKKNVSTVTIRRTDGTLFDKQDVLASTRFRKKETKYTSTWSMKEKTPTKKEMGKSS